MNKDDYIDLYKKAIKDSASAKSAGKNPHLKVLEDMVKESDIAARTELGLITIQMDQIEGTDTEARSNAFSPSYLPMLDVNSEFASKYIALHTSCEEEGLREPVIGFEYLGKYYIREGNKRVSVSKQLGLQEIEGMITRIVPKRSDNPDIVLNFEYIDFYEKTKGINFLYFSKPSQFGKFFEMVAGDADCFTVEQKENVYSSFLRFKKEFEKKQKRLPMSSSDAYYTYVKLLEFDEIKDKSTQELQSDIDRIWKEFWTQTLDTPIAVSEKPMKEKGMTLIKKIALKVAKPLKIAFVHMGNIENSAWVYSHELGRQYLEQTFGSELDTEAFFNISIDDADEFMEELCKKKYDVIFTTSAQHAAACTKVAINYPGVKILNCSLNDSTKFVRTYYLRTYECKFLLGMIAGALTQTGKIAYVADYPVYGTIASVNAFALGLSAINPSAKIYLSWTSRKTGDDYWEIDKTGCDVVSNLDWSSPRNITKKFGLYANEENPVNLAAPLWDWGKLYESIINGIRKGNWDIEESEVGKKSLSYWWGISSGAMDMIYSKKVPIQTMRLINFLKEKISSGEFNIFSGELAFSDGTKIDSPNGLSYTELIEMDKLLWNILGSIPSSDELKEETVSLAKVQGALEKED